jgi:hypothetical protein
MKNNEHLNSSSIYVGDVNEEKRTKVINLNKKFKQNIHSQNINLQQP